MINNNSDIARVDVVIDALIIEIKLPQIYYWTISRKQ
jgi:hypothetical protein